MKVRHGWSGEIKPNVWGKVQIELEEEDLRRLLMQNDLPADFPISVNHAYQLLEVEAERLLTAKLISRFGFDGQDQLAALTEQRIKIIEKLKSMAK